MTGFTPTPLALVFVFAALTIVLLVGYILLNGRMSWAHPTTRTLVYVLAASALWTSPYTLHLIATDPQWKLMWFNLSHVGASLVVPAFVVHVATIAGYHNWFTRPRLALLGIEPAVTTVLVVTEPFHSLLRTDVSLVSVGATTIMHRGIGPWWFLRSPYLYLLMAVVFLIIPIAYWRASWLTRRQLLIAGGAIAIPVGVNVIFDLQFFGTPSAPPVFVQVELTGVALAITAVILTGSVLHYRYLDLAFVARRVAIDHLRDPYAVIDDDGKIIDHNPRFSALVEADSTIYGEAIGTYTPGIEALLDGNEQTDSELSIAGHGWFEVHRVPILPGKTTPNDDRSAWTNVRGSDRRSEQASDASGHVLIFRDVTDRKRREQTLETRNEQLAVLNQIVNHDIHNEMDLAFALTRRVRRDIEGETPSERPDEVVEYLDQVVESADRVVELTETARGVVEALDGAEQNLEPIALKPLLEQEYLYATAHEGAQIAIDGDVPDVEVRANDMLASVFRNLLGNAVIHNDKPTPEITISAQERDDEVAVDIADNGPGIPRERREALVAGEDASPEDRGSGFGLVLVRTSIDQYGGSMSIDDRAGGGTVVTIVLQRADSVSSDPVDR